MFNPTHYEVPSYKYVGLNAAGMVCYLHQSNDGRGYLISTSGNGLKLTLIVHLIWPQFRDNTYAPISPIVPNHIAVSPFKGSEKCVEEIQQILVPYEEAYPDQKEMADRDAAYIGATELIRDRLKDYTNGRCYGNDEVTPSTPYIHKIEVDGTKVLMYLYDLDEDRAKKVIDFLSTLDD